MPYADTEKQASYQTRYVSKDFVFKPNIFKRDFPDDFIAALKIQCSVDQARNITDGTVSATIARLLVKGLVEDGRLKL